MSAYREMSGEPGGCQGAGLLQRLRKSFSYLKNSTATESCPMRKIKPQDQSGFEFLRMVYNLKIYKQYPQFVND